MMLSRMRGWWMLLFLPLAAGCVRYHDRPLSAIRGLEAFEARTLDRADLKVYLQEHLPAEQWPIETWNLTDLTLAAFFYHSDLDVARAQLKTAKGEIVSAGERPNPSISISPAFNATNRESVSGVSSWILDAALDIPIETAGKRGYRITQAQRLSDAALLDLYAARETEIYLLRQQTIQSDNVHLLQLQQVAGEISPFQVSLARIPLNATRLEVVDAQKKRAEARAKLAAAIGTPIRTLDGVDFSFDALTAIPQALPAAEVRREALLGRADLRAALAEYEASQSALQLEIARQYPNLNIGQGYSYDQSENKWSLGISLALPAFNQNQGAIAVAEGRRAEAAARFNALQAGVVAQVEQALVGYEASLKKLQLARTLAEELQQKADATRKMFEAGALLKLEVVTADLEVSMNALARLDARIETLQALGQVEDALQRPADLPQWQEMLSQNQHAFRRDAHHDE